MTQTLPQSLYIAYVGDGSTTTFNYGTQFNVDALSDISVTVDDVAVTPLGYDATAGTVTLSVAPAVDSTVAVFRNTSLVQTIAGNDNEEIAPTEIVNALDRAYRAMQEAQDRASRSVQVERGQNAVTMPTPETGKAPVWDGDGNLVNSTTDISGLEDSISGIAASVAQAQAYAEAAESIVLPDDSVTQVKIADGSITADKLADDSVTNDKLADDSVTAAKLADDSVTTDKLANLSALITPAGAVMAFAAETAPTGFLVCNGATINRTSYAGLFAIIGTVYGAGDGINTFAVPDLRGEFLRGFDGGRGVDSGRDLGTAQADALGEHFHYTMASATNPESGTVTSTDQVARAATKSGSSNQSYIARPTGFSANVGKSSSTGGDETRPRNIALMHCIKY